MLFALLMLVAIVICSIILILIYACAYYTNYRRMTEGQAWLFYRVGCVFIILLAALTIYAVYAN